MVCSAQTVHLSCAKVSNISKQAKTTIHLRLVTKEYHRVRLKWFLSLWYVQRKPCTYLASRFALSQNIPKRASAWATPPRSTIGCVQNDLCVYGTFGANRAPILHWHYNSLQMDWNEIPHDQCHIGDPSGASKMISDPMLSSAQTVHLYYVKISTISKETKTSIHLSPFSKEYHRVCLKWFLSLWYVRRKPCTYLVSRLALSPNRLKQVTTWASSPRSTIECIPKWFLSYV
jgi:hypothetical protein